MKWKLFITGLRSFVLVSFNNAMQQRILMLSMEGKYRRSWIEDEKAIMETVKVKQVSASGGIHKIVRVLCKQDGPDRNVFYEHQVDKWLATYDSAKRQLTELGGKRKCSFHPEDELMFLNDIKFEKIEWRRPQAGNLINKLV